MTGEQGEGPDVDELGRPVARREVQQLPDGSTREVIRVGDETFPARAPYAKPLEQVIAEGRRRGRPRRPPRDAWSGRWDR